MVKKKLVLLLFLLFVLKSYGQGIDNLWLMGYEDVDHGVNPNYGGTTIDFSSGAPSIYYASRPMWFDASNAVISDKSGNLLFYTNGYYIANVNNDTMLNGSGLNPSSYTSGYGPFGLTVPQADLIIPFSGDSSKYYLFHATLDSATLIPVYLYYTIIDMTLDGGLGGVVSKNNILLHSAFYFGCITACKHANGRDWWLITHENTSNCYVKFLITPNGIFGPFYQCIGKYVDILAGWGVSGLGQVVFSSDGTKFGYYDTEGDLDLMNFDRCSGDFSNLIHVVIDDSASIGGVVFSSNSKKLYVSSMNFVYQFDLSASDIPSTQTTVAVWDSSYDGLPIFSTTFYLAQLAPNGKIYIATGNGTRYLHVINYPDNLGMACDVCQHCIHLPTYNAQTVPNYPNYFLGADSGSVCDSIPSLTLTLSKGEGVAVFPNPATRILYATLSSNSKFKSVKVLNAFGQEMALNYSFIKNNEYLEVNTTSLSQGVYFLELLSEKEKVVKRFVKE